MIPKIFIAALALGGAGGASIGAAENLNRASVSPALVEPASAPILRDAAAVCEPIRFRVYFERGARALNPAAHELIAEAASAVAACGQVDVELAAREDALARPGDRRRTAERSVAVLNALRAQGIEAAVYVTDINEHILAPEPHAGPDFIEVLLAPAKPAMVAANDERVL
jgi:hypothetical protein